MANIPMPTLLDDLKRRKLLKIQESYKKCMANVKEALRSLEILKNEVAELENMRIFDNKLSKKEGPATFTKHLKVEPMSEVLEGQEKSAKEEKRSLDILKNEVAEINDRCILADKASTEKSSAKATKYLKLKPICELLECQEKPNQDDTHPDYVSQMEQQIKIELEKPQHIENDTVFTSNIPLTKVGVKNEIKNSIECDPCNFTSQEKLKLLKREMLGHILPHIRNQNKSTGKTRPTENVTSRKNLHRFTLSKNLEKKAKVIHAKSKNDKLHLKCDTCNYACNKLAQFNRHKQACS